MTPDPDTDLALDADNGVAKVEGYWVRVEKVSDKELEAWKARRREELRGSKQGGAGLEDDLCCCRLRRCEGGPREGQGRR